ncbi:MAG TPA: hypothetical protein VJS44_20130 [Pyrinomonadaceae bacterium]|nr:hypothetical protein [Pyrinomonadaceae bacterium]
MKDYKRVSILLVITCLVTVMAVSAARRAQNQNRVSDSKDEKIKERLSKLPIVEYDAQEPLDPEKLNARRQKGKKFDKARSPIDPSSKMVQASIHNDWEWGLSSALPVAQSSTIFIGDVIDSKAFLSNDKTGVYSEFTVRVVELFKSDDYEPLTTGNSVAIERQGGRVRTPSGHIQSYTISGQGTPEVGKRYLFFLGYNPREASTINVTEPKEMSRNILTAYELREGRVFPLDNAGGRDFKAYSGADLTSFLNDVRRALTNPS